MAEDLQRLADARHHDPHAILGTQRRDGETGFLALLPGIVSARLESGPVLARVNGTDFFYARVDGSVRHETVIWEDGRSVTGRWCSPYDFAPSLSSGDLALFASGRHLTAWRMLGAHPATFDDVQGVRFAVWAPNAERVSVVGPFCEWDGRRLPMRAMGDSGVWELFVPGLAVGQLYKFEIRNRQTGDLLLKTDPYAQAMEMRPATASIVTGDDTYRWQDDRWMQERRDRDWLHAPLSIYEVHLGSWQRHPDGRFLSYRELAAELIPYVARLGFTHIELLPITEHPLDDSWGYQTTGYFAPTRRFGTPDDLRYFIDQCHLHGIGVLLDWVPGHFPRDAHGLGRFDGTALYEYADPRKGEHQDWGTYIFNYERFEVQTFLLASACFWLEEFHFDGLRVDAVASMLYLDYARGSDYVTNRYGGNQNLEAIEFLRELNSITHSRVPGTVVIAEESTSWPMVSRPVNSGGLGFSMKWNMGWMHDTLSYFKEDPVYRSHHHSKLTFGMVYAYSENFVLPLSHDEVVHLKRSLVGRMPGDRWQQMANLRLLYTYMWTLPGKKLLFMGGEIGHPWEWDFRHGLPWFLMEYPEHQGVQRLIGDLNRLYVSEPALHALEFQPQGFSWIDCDDAQHSTLSYLRIGAHGEMLAVALNLTPVPRENYRLGVPQGGSYRAVFNSDSEYYGGANLGDLVLVAQEGRHGGQPFHLELTLPPLAGIVFKRT
ncbi:MAG: 1,4-alpha-glucan branching protein GlgB [Steroidobacteraceae bacterium]